MPTLCLNHTFLLVCFYSPYTLSLSRVSSSLICRICRCYAETPFIKSSAEGEGQRAGVCDPLPWSILSCRAHSAVLTARTLCEGVPRPWGAAGFGSGSLQNLPVPWMGVSCGLWWFESHLGHPDFLLLWMCSTLNSCFLVM